MEVISGKINKSLLSYNLLYLEYGSLCPRESDKTWPNTLEAKPRAGLKDLPSVASALQKEPHSVFAEMKLRREILELVYGSKAEWITCPAAVAQ